MEFSAGWDWEKLKRENRVLRKNFDQSRETILDLLHEQKQLGKQIQELRKTQDKFVNSLWYKLFQRFNKSQPAPPEPEREHQAWDETIRSHADKLLRKEFNSSALDGLRFCIELLAHNEESQANEASPVLPEIEGLPPMHWLVPDVPLNTGTVLTPFRMICFLSRYGFPCHIWICGPSTFANEKEAQKAVDNHFIPMTAEVHFLEPGNIAKVKGGAVFATDRWTAYFARAIRRVSHKFYFIQDWESDFFPAGSEALLTTATLDFGMIPITAGKWLSRKVREYLGDKAPGEIITFPLALNPNIYFPGPLEKPAREKKQIAFYTRADSPRRCVELGLMALELLARRRDDFDVALFGDIYSHEWQLGFPAEHKGFLRGPNLAQLYRESDIGLTLAATNYSLLPLEMMSCALPVVTLDATATRDTFPPEVVEMAVPTPSGIADSLEKLLDEPNRQARSEAGLAFASQFHWEDSARTVIAAIAREMDLDFVVPEKEELLEPAEGK